MIQNEIGAEPGSNRAQINLAPAPSTHRHSKSISDWLSLLKIVSAYPGWIGRPEHRAMLLRMAARLWRESTAAVHDQVIGRQ